MKLPTPEAFREACGAIGPLELDVWREDREGIVRWSLPHPFALVGSLASADVPLAARDIAPRHVYLQILDGHLLGVDLGSPTGTIWPGGRGMASWIRTGENISLGPYRMRPATGSLIEGFPSSTASPLGSDSNAAFLLPTIRVACRNGPDTVPVPDLTRVVTLVGRSELCKLRLTDTSVSRVHCSLVNTSHGVLLFDLGGRGAGVVVNGSAVRFALLTEGDEVQLGIFTLRFKQEGQVFPRPTSTSLILTSPTPGQLGQPLAFPAREVSLSTEDSILAPMMMQMLQQFANMQQQFFDHFQQTLFTMLQMMETQNQLRLAAPAPENPQLQEMAQLLREIRQNMSEQPTPNPPTPAKPGKSAPPPSTETPAGTATGVGGSAEPAEHLHSMLADRLQALSEEQQGRWQKLLRFLKAN